VVAAGDEDLDAKDALQALRPAHGAEVMAFARAQCTTALECVGVCAKPTGRRAVSEGCDAESLGKIGSVAS